MGATGQHNNDKCIILRIFIKRQLALNSRRGRCACRTIIVIFDNTMLVALLPIEHSFKKK